MNANDLKKCLDILLDHAKEVHEFTGLDLEEHDYYWSVPYEQWLQMESVPTVAVGSLVDDMNELKKLVNDPSRASALDLERLANILRLLSDQLA